jgi:MFS transporter, FSR family, fosmidomycin resistance protein
MEKFPIFLIFLGHLWVDASQGILPVALVKLKETFDMTYFQMGLITAVLNISSSVIQPIFGYISDRFRLGWFVPYGILWTAVSMGLLGWAPNYTVLLLLVGFAGLGTAAFHPRGMMTVALLSGSRKGFGTAIFSTGGNLGFALGPVIGGFLILTLGLRATIALIIPAILITLAILLYRRNFLQLDGAFGRSASAEGQTLPPIPWIPLSLVCLTITFRTWVSSSYMTYLPTFLHDQGVGLESASLMLTGFLACGAAVGLLGGHISDKVGRKSVIIATMLVYPFFASMMILTSGPWLWFFVLASGAFLMASFSVSVVLAQELLPGRLGLAAGLTLGFGFGMGGVGAALSGQIADWIGLHDTMWVLAFVPVLGSITTAFIRIAPRRAKRREEARSPARNVAT